MCFDNKICKIYCKTLIFKPNGAKYGTSLILKLALNFF